MTSRCGSRWMFSILIMAATSISTTLWGQETYEPGGPLMGVKLPLYPTRFGEPAGQPGAIPELAAQAKVADPKSTDFTPQGMAPVPQLYPGSVEHWRTYFGKYLSIKSFF